jgi:hypothetical protein
MSKNLEDIDIGKYGYPAQITFADPKGISNYYVVEVLIENCSYGCSEGNATGTVNEILVEELKVNTSGNTDVEIGGGPERIDGLRYIYLSDEGFDGETVTLKFFVIPVHVDFESNQNIMIKFILKSITNEYYEYLKTSNFQLELGDGSNLAEPVQIATNVQNGLGTFAGYNYAVYTLRP